MMGSDMASVPKTQEISVTDFQTQVPRQRKYLHICFKAVGF